MVTVIINCHNCLEYLEKALSSVLAQTEEDWEVVFWDNASDTPAKDVVNGLNDPRIRYFYNHEFVSLGEARNEAIRNARGDFIAFLDADDFWAPQKLERQLKTFLINPRAGIVYSDAAIVYGKKLTKQVFARKKPPEGEVFGELLSDYFLVMSSVMIRRTALDALPVWFDPRFEIIEEFDLFLRIAAEWDVACSNEVLAFWRWHKSSTTMRKRGRISLEKRLLLKKLHQLYPVLMLENHLHQKKVKGKILISLALSEYYANRPSRARRILRRSNEWSRKGVFVYLASFLPVNLVDLIYRKIKGNPLV